MAITRNAKKAIRASAHKRVFNVRTKAILREAVKSVKTNIKDKKYTEATTQLSVAYKALDKAAKRGVIKANTASRSKSRLAQALAKAGK